MRELQKQVKKFLAREIELDELQRRFALLLDDDDNLAATAAAWLDAGERDGRLSSAVCSSLKDVIVSHIAGRNSGPDPRESGLFDEVDRPRKQQPSRNHDRAPPAPPPPSSTVVRVEAATVKAAATEPAAQGRAGPADGSAPKLRVGSTIGGRYELLKQLGSGGMGRVFKARDSLRAEAQDRNPYVALKVLSEKFKAHPDSMIALQREVRRAQTLAHPNVITVHEFFRDGPHFYMTMELLDGNPLDQLIRDEYADGLAFEQAWPIIEGVGKALKYGHQKGIVHSDIKPGNIFICSDGTIKVLDLGISRPMVRTGAPESENTVFDPGKRLGSLTPAYASLEMWYQDSPDPRDDIYALACVSYLLLAGRHPFTGRSAKIAHEKGLKPERIDSITRGQWATLAKALELKRDDRTKTVVQFLSKFAMLSVKRSRRRVFLAVAGSALAMATAIGVRQYVILVEEDALDYRSRMQTTTAPAPVERPELTPEQQAEIDDLMLLADRQLVEANQQSRPDSISYLLSHGPNSVLRLAEAVLVVDPGYEDALAMKKRVHETYVAMARQKNSADDYESAMQLLRWADELEPNTRAVLRLQRSICNEAPTVCAAN